MDLGEILRVVRVRWYVVAPFMTLAVVLSVLAYVKVATPYESYSTVSLLSSPSATAANAANEGNHNDNPFLNFNGSLVATADFLGRSLQSTDAKTDLQGMGVTEDYEVSLAEGAQGPFLTFTVTGTDPDHILSSTAKIGEYAEERLAEIQRQNGVKTADMVRMTQIVPPQTPQPQLKDKLEIVIGVGGGMAALAVLVTFVFESVVRSRRRRGKAAEVVSAASKPEPVVNGKVVSRPALPLTMDDPPTQPVATFGRSRANRAGIVNGTSVPNGAKGGTVSSGRPVERRPAQGDETVIIKLEPVSGPAPSTERRPDIDDTVAINIPALSTRVKPETGEGPRTPRAISSPPGSSSSSTTYRSSEGSDRRGQDVDRVNGS